MPSQNSAVLSIGTSRNTRTITNEATADQTKVPFRPMMKFPPMGPFMTELYPTEIRGTGQGFCYNAGRAAGSLFPTMVGYLSQVQSLGISIAICSATAFGLMIVTLLLLPQTHGRSLATFGDRGGRRSIVVACLFAELTISATADLALSFLNVVPATFREWRRPTG